MWLKRSLRFLLNHSLLSLLVMLLIVAGGLTLMPFEGRISWVSNFSISIDALPNIGENQQIIFTRWPGHSPQDVEDQISYPLTTYLLGLPGVANVRSNSFFGFSSIYLTFEDHLEFYWSRNRILEKLNAIPPQLLPQSVTPELGPPATALGQVFWYTLEGRDSSGQTTGGWDLHELRKIQDFQVRYALQATPGVAEVASVGGFVQEFQIVADPSKLRLLNVSLSELLAAIKGGNRDSGAGTLEINRAEYFIRGLGKFEGLGDIELCLIKVSDSQPIYVKDVAQVTLGPAERRGALDKSGAEVVGGVVSVQYDAKPMEVLSNLHKTIAQLQNGMPSKVLKNGRKSTLHIVPFYDRSQLISRSLNTLQHTLALEILITILVILAILFRLRAALVVFALLPLSVLLCFILMYATGIDANILSLAGIAVAIGSVVDIGIVIVENIIANSKRGQKLRKRQIVEGFVEVYPAVFTAIATTIISFLPVFFLQAEEGKLFRPLAFTKTYVMASALALALIALPVLLRIAYHKKLSNIRSGGLSHLILLIPAIYLFVHGSAWAIILSMLTGVGIASHFVQDKWKKRIMYGGYLLVMLMVLVRWWPVFGIETAHWLAYVLMLLCGILFFLFYYGIIRFYSKILKICIENTFVFLAAAICLIFAGIFIWSNSEQEFMPALDEGEFLLMPTAMPHGGIEENLELLKTLDMRVTAVPEVELVVGKMGRANSALDPAPISMFENLIRYKSEYRTDDSGQKMRFRTDKSGAFVRSAEGELIPDSKGKYFRQWRPHIHSTNDIWNEIAQVSRIPGLTAAPRLYPIETRLVMLQTGMKAPLGIKVKGSNLKEMEDFSLALEKILKNIKGIRPATVIADRTVAKPYLLIDIDRVLAARYGLQLEQIQQQIEMAIGGKPIGEVIQGRQRFDIAIRYPRATRNSPEAIEGLLIHTPRHSTIPLGEVVEIRYETGAQMIKSEDGFLVSYITFDKQPDYDAGRLVSRANEHIQNQIISGALTLPPNVSYHFAGSFEQQLRASKRIRLVMGLSLLLIFSILYWQFRSVLFSLLIFSSILLAFAGGFVFLWLYGQDWFLNIPWFGGSSLRQIFAMEPVALSVAVWIGFLVLLGIATDDGVLIATFIKKNHGGKQLLTQAMLYNIVEKAGLRRVRPAMMTTATTILALLPILSSTSTGSDVMIPIAIPLFGGMVFQVMSIFMIPVLYHLWQSRTNKNIR